MTSFVINISIWLVSVDCLNTWIMIKSVTENVVAHVLGQQHLHVIIEQVAGPDHPWGWWGWSLRARASTGAQTARYNENLQSRTTLGPEISREKICGLLNKVNIAHICTRGTQSLSCLRARRDHDPALTGRSKNWRYDKDDMPPSHKSPREIHHCIGIQYVIYDGRSGVTKVGVTRGGNWRCHPFSPKKTDGLFQSSPSAKMMTFLPVVSSQLPPPDVVCPVFFLNSATKNSFHLDVTPGWCHPGRSATAPLAPTSDATDGLVITCSKPYTTFYILLLERF